MVTGVDDGLLGWDLVFSSTYDAINKAIVDKGTSPKTLDLDDPKYGQVKGTFKDWQLLETDSAQGKNVVLSVPFTLTSWVNKTGTDITSKFPKKSYLLEVEVALEFGTKATLPLGSTQQHLSISAPDPATGLNTHVDVRNSSTSTFDNYIFTAAQTWLAKHVNTFTHVFASTITDLTDKNSVFSKLLPKTDGIAYAVAGQASSTAPIQHGPNKGKPQPAAPAVFSILCRLDGTIPAGATVATSKDKVPEGCDYGLAISSTAFFNIILADKIEAAMQLQKKSKFGVTTGHSIALTNLKPAVLPDIDLSDLGLSGGGLSGTNPTFKPGCFEVKIDGTQLQITFVDLTFEDDTGLNKFTMNYAARFDASITPEGHFDLVDADNNKAHASIVLTKAGVDYQIWTAAALNVVVQLVTIALCLIPGAEPAAAEVKGAAEATVATDESVADAAMTDAAEADAAEADAVEEMSKTGKIKQKLKGLCKKFGKRIAVGLAVGLSMKAISDFPTILAMIRKGMVNPTPTMHDLATSMLSANLWNGDPATKMKCKSVQFNGGVILGLEKDTS